MKFSKYLKENDDLDDVDLSGLPPDDEWVDMDEDEMHDIMTNVMGDSDGANELESMLDATYGDWVARFSNEFTDKDYAERFFRKMKKKFKL